MKTDLMKCVDDEWTDSEPTRDNGDRKMTRGSLLVSKGKKKRAQVENLCARKRRASSETVHTQKSVAEVATSGAGVVCDNDGGGSGGAVAGSDGGGVRRRTTHARE